MNICITIRSINAGEFEHIFTNDVEIVSFHDDGIQVTKTDKSTAYFEYIELIDIQEWKTDKTYETPK